MIMRIISIPLLPVLMAGCATQRPVTLQTPPPLAIAAASPTKFVETRYDVRAYRDAADSSLRHEEHAVFRRTRVPVATSVDLETVPLALYPPSSVTPLPASEELNAELASQKKITAELRAMEASLVETQRQMQSQYAVLARQSAEALKLREQLENERNRIRTLSPSESRPPAPLPAPGASAEVKW
jgi:hypothetical protein